MNIAGNGIDISMNHQAKIGIVLILRLSIGILHQYDFWVLIMDLLGSKHEFDTAHGCSTFLGIYFCRRCS